MSETEGSILHGGRPVSVDEIMAASGLSGRYRDLLVSNCDTVRTQAQLRGIPLCNRLARNRVMNYIRLLVGPARPHARMATRSTMPDFVYSPEALQLVEQRVQADLDQMMKCAEGCGCAGLRVRPGVGGCQLPA